LKAFSVGIPSESGVTKPLKVFKVESYSIFGIIAEQSSDKKTN
jgi:hypothetical protein